MERNTNLFTETVDSFACHGHTLENIEFVTLYGMDIDLDEFVRFAHNFDYDAGYGREYVPPFIVMMNDGTWYERAEYDGSEWWQLHKAPNPPELYGSIADALDKADVAWMYKRAYEHAVNTTYEIACAEELAKYETALYEERMDALVDEIEVELDKPTESGKWADYSGKCANKARCKRYVYNERRYELGGGGWSKPNSRCWKDQRGKGAKKRYHQYR